MEFHFNFEMAKLRHSENICPLKNFPLRDCSTAMTISIFVNNIGGGEFQLRHLALSIYLLNRVYPQ